MLYFYKRDTHEPEPQEKVAQMMGWGALCVIPALILELTAPAIFPLVNGDNLFSIALNAYLVVALAEELCKFIAVKKKIYDDPELDEPYDGVVYCVATSLGFAIVENVLYVFSGGFGVGILRALMAVPAHALFAVFMGYYVGKSKFVEDPGLRTRYLATGLLVAVASHGTYDFVLFTNIPALQLTVFPLLGLFWAVALWKVRKAVAVSPFAPGNQASVVVAPATPAAPAEWSDLAVPEPEES